MCRCIFMYTFIQGNSPWMLAPIFFFKNAIFQNMIFGIFKFEKQKCSQDTHQYKKYIVMVFKYI